MWGGGCSRSRILRSTFPGRSFQAIRAVTRRVGRGSPGERAGSLGQCQEPHRLLLYFLPLYFFSLTQTLTVGPGRPSVSRNSVEVVGMRVALAGVGMIGTSLALDLKALGHQVWGYDSDPEHLAEAQAMGALDGSLPQLAGSFDLILLAAPPQACLELVQSPCQAPLWLDVASVKAPIVAAAMARAVPFVGGHPLAGSAGSGPQAATAGLFQNRGFALCPGGGPLAQAISLVTSLRAHPFVLSAEVHDREVAASSHVLYLLSAALAQRLAGTAPELIGPAAHEWLRLASAPAALYQEILTLNQEAVTVALDDLMAQARRLLDRGAYGSAEQLAQKIRERWESDAG
ncbi:MAG: prephenate dehydrogenase [Sulfobacillus sp.]